MIDFVAYGAGETMLGQCIEISQFSVVRDTKFGAAWNEFSDFQQLAIFVVFLLDEVKLHFFDVVLQDVLYFAQIKVRVVLLEVFVMNSEADYLSEKGTSESSSYQLTIRTTERRFVQTFAHDTPRELVMFQLQIRRPFVVRMHQSLLRLTE